MAFINILARRMKHKILSVFGYGSPKGYGGNKYGA